MCSINTNCEAFNFESSQCTEAGASNLVGALPESQTAKNVYINQDLYNNNKGNKV